MAFIKDSRKRRSDRLMFMIPLRVSGLTETGDAFECQGHAIAVNRYGAHIRLERPVPVADKVLLTNLENNLRGEFRIVRALESSSAGKTDFGIEAFANYPTFWGIGFPARPHGSDESRGLLECTRCRSASLHPLMLDEIEALETGGTVRKPCSSCGSKTEWKFAMVGAPATLPESGPAAPGKGPPAGQMQPGKPTVFMQRPVSIRTASGEVETVLTENLSRDEIRCASEKSYEVNQVLTLEWENSGMGQRLQVAGRVRRRQGIAGSRRVVYSLRHEGTPVVLPPLPLKSAQTIYVAMGALIAGASLLLAVSVRGLVSNLSVPSGTVARRVAYLGVVLLLVALAHKAWKAIVGREPERRSAFRKRHLMAAWLMAVVFLGSLGAGVIAGVASGYQSVQARKVLHDFAVARIFESNIDAAENRVTASPADYADVCATLELLAQEWQTSLDALSADDREFSRLQLWPNARFRKEMSGLAEVIALDRRKLEVVREQIALRTEGKSLDPDKQQAFWQSRFPPLRQQIRDLDAQKNQVVKSLVAEK